MMKPSPDFSSGMDSDHEAVTLVQPTGSPGFGENHAFWMHDEATGMQINGHINTREDLGAYRQRVGKMSITFPDGRLYLLREHGANSSADTTAAGNMRFRCVEPFQRWQCTYEGVLQDATIARNYMTAGALDFPLVPIVFDIECDMVAPLWEQGSLTEGGLGPVNTFIGGRRYEQLFRNRGTVTIGNQRFPIDGFGTRTHRWGVRDLTATASAPRMLGHVWASAAFPSGAGFGLQIFPTADGGVLWGEGFIAQNGQINAAEIVAVPWLTSYRIHGEEFPIRLRTRDGVLHEIRGFTLSAAVSQMLPGATPADQIPILQASARYTYNGETATNMLERSLRRGAIETGFGRPARE